MSEPLPKFNHPPVSETALSVQFGPVRGYTSAHSGRFWKEVLGDDWPMATEAPHLPEIFERFGADQMAGNVLVGAINVNVSGLAPRLQFRDKTGERMIQLQDTRFVYNWSRGSQHYPSFDKLLPEFEKYFSSFSQFCRSIQDSDLQLNQWEVTYVNNFAKDDMWKAPGEWPNIIPQFVFPGADIKNQNPNTAAVEWQLSIGDNKGRLHVSLIHGRMGSPGGPEGLVLQLVARGPLTPDIRIRNGFMCGHEAIVRTFASMTSKSAHEKWQRTA